MNMKHRRRRALHAGPGGLSDTPGLSPAQTFPAGPVGVDRQASTPVTAQRPTARTVLAGFTKIFHPTAALAGTAVEAWYGLRRLKIERPADQCALTGYQITTISPRTATAGAAIQWATAGGFDAFIVIGRNLTQIQPGAWTRMGSPLPFATGNTTLQARGSWEGDIIAACAFPSGGWADAAPQQKELVREFGLETYPLKVGDTLDVGLVILNSRLTAVGTNYVEGFGLVQLKTAELYQSRTLDA